MGARGAVVSNHPLATEAGLRTLRRGGNAIDAAVAIGFALAIAEPQSSGLGGDGFMMIHTKPLGVAKGQIDIVNGTGAAPLAATRELYRDGIPQKGPLSASVPGVVKAMVEAHTRFGWLKLAECIEPAIELCEEGVPTTHRVARLLESEPPLLDYASTRAIYAPSGRLVQAGEVVRNPDLSATMQAIAEGGATAFYKGPIAREIVRSLQEHGGVMTEDDLARHTTRWQEPISTTYRRYRVYEAPPNSSGHILLQQLAMTELADIPAIGVLSANGIHHMVEAKRMAFADREAYVADPEYVDIPLEGLLSAGYAAARTKLIDENAAASSGSVREGDPWAHQDAGPEESKRFRRQFEKVTQNNSGTTHFAVIDKWGNAVSQLQSLQTNFGSALVAGDTGVLMNNRMTYWHLDDDHIDALHPGQRVRHTMNPVMALDAEGKLRIVCGTPGGDTQVQTNLQMLAHAIDFGFTSSECVEAPRWAHNQNPMQSGYPHTVTEELRVEGRVPPETIEALRKKGHDVRVIGSWEGIGSAGMIQIHPETGVFMAAIDPRRDGHAAAW